MKNILFTICCLLFTGAVIAQKKIAVQTGNNSSFYQTLDSAMSYASNGDIIYVPGGTYVVTNLIIDKSVQLIGAGHYPDSCLATGRSIITGNIKITNSAGNGSISGFYIMGNIYFGTSNGTQQVNNFGIVRNSFNSVHLSFDGNPTSTNFPTNILIAENVVRANVHGSLCPNIVYQKNIINGLLYDHSGSIFENNVFLNFENCYPYFFLNNVNGSYFSNNVFCNGTGQCGVYFFSNSNYNAFSNNVFRDTKSSYFPHASDIESNNYFGFNSTASDLFSSATSFAFAYNENYHILASHPAHNNGTDGHDPGIYGTSSPYKEGAVPANPHISHKSISSATDAAGNLNVNIIVQAQTH